MNAPADDILDIVVLAPKESFTSVLFWLLVAILALIAMGVSIWLAFRNRTQSQSSPPPEIRVAHALKQLRVAREQLEPNQFSLRTSSALKDFLTEKFGEPVRYETTQEFLKRSTEEGSQLPEAAKNSLLEFLVAADELKFGNLADADERTAPLLEKAGQVVQACEQASPPPNATTK